MYRVYITGHKNPDLDSVCSAFAYARLKNQLDSSSEYIAVTSSPASTNVLKQLEIVGMEPLPCVSDINPMVEDIYLTSDGFEGSEPIYDLVQTYTTEKPSVVPIYDHGKYMGLLSVDDITSWFLKDNSEMNPVYEFTEENLMKVIPGKILHGGKADEYQGKIVAAAADYREFAQYIDEHPDSIIITGMREGHLFYAIKKRVPAIIITAMKEEQPFDYSEFDGLVYQTELTTAETIRRLRMTQKLSSIMGTQQETAELDDYFEDIREVFMTSHTRGLAVMDGDEYKGFVTRRCFLKTPEKHVILVDHNESDQSMRGIETAVIDEIVDHHRLNALRTELPIYINVEPVGSTCTIVLDQYVKNEIEPDEISCRALLTGILSDTLILSSPTTTEKDIRAVSYLAEKCNLDYQEYGEKLMSVTDRLASADEKEIISADLKKYDTKNMRFAVGQCEVTTLSDLDEYKERYISELEKLKGEYAVDWMGLMITDVLKKNSILLVTDHRVNRKIPFEKLEDCIYSMPQVLSRKKQLLPELLHIMS